MLCRSGNRSAQAAEAAFNAGFEHIYNVLEGFEGDLNEQQQRNQKMAGASTNFLGNKTNTSINFQ